MRAEAISDGFGKLWVRAASELSLFQFATASPTPALSGELVRGEMCSSMSPGIESYICASNLWLEVLKADHSMLVTRGLALAPESSKENSARTMFFQAL